LNYFHFWLRQWGNLVELLLCYGGSSLKPVKAIFLAFILLGGGKFHIILKPSTYLSARYRRGIKAQLAIVFVYN
jgi:hypothetical protein